MTRKAWRPGPQTAKHLPTPEEIAAACLAIRLEWPEWDERRRRQVDQYQPVTVTRCRISECVRKPRE